MYENQDIPRACGSTRAGNTRFIRLVPFSSKSPVIPHIPPNSTWPVSLESPHFHKTLVRSSLTPPYRESEDFHSRSHFTNHQPLTQIESQTSKRQQHLLDFVQFRLRFLLRQPRELAPHQHRFLVPEELQLAPLRLNG